MCPVCAPFHRSLVSSVLALATFRNAARGAIVSVMVVRFELNDEPIVVEHVDPHVTLLEWLRASGRTGTKEGCAEGECGACAVALLDRDVAGRSCLSAVNSCLLPLPAVHGRSVISVEGIAGSSGALHPVQRAMIDCGGSQCGYCTPGFIVSLFCEYYRPSRAGYDPEAISGNLCRCTGYRPIAQAARSLPILDASDPSDPRAAWLARAEPSLPAFEHAHTGVRYLRPESLVQLFALWTAHPNATLIAGGTDLLVYTNQRDTRYPVLIALDAVTELRTLQLETNGLSIGAALPLSQLEASLGGPDASEWRLLAQLLPLFSSRLIRNRATLGGNLCTASPIGDSAPALLVLDAALTLCRADGMRRLPLADFFLDYRKSALGERELVRSVHLPRPAPRIQEFYKVSKRVLDDISTVSAAFALDLDAARRVERLRIAFGGVASTPLRAQAVEQAAQGQAWNEQTVERLGQLLAGVGTPLSDHRGSAQYRRALLPKLLEKFYLSSVHALEQSAGRS